MNKIQQVSTTHSNHIFNRATSQPGFYPDTGARPAIFQFCCGFGLQIGAGHQWSSLSVLQPHNPLSFPRLLLPFIPSRSHAHNLCCQDVDWGQEGGEGALLPNRGRRSQDWGGQADVLSSNLEHSLDSSSWTALRDWWRCLLLNLLDCVCLLGLPPFISFPSSHLFWDTPGLAAQGEIGDILPWGVVLVRYR